jgi:hypothetical protein
MNNKYLDVNLYQPPDGKTSVICMRHIEPEDVEFFKNGKYIVSMESFSNGGIAVYAYPGSMDEVNEVIVLDRSRSCRETMKELRELCEKTFN